LFVTNLYHFTVIGKGQVKELNEVHGHEEAVVFEEVFVSIPE